ncbi:MAG TPA: hypothetical protein VNZ64_22970 [Candidatus Acidoferrum sp.]|jgi:hypothetical protein|nr:hypothetical protein [Candidatus Acidoferrum sp.]
MKKFLAVSGLLLALAGHAAAQNDTLFTNPVIVVSPMTLDFGPVPKHTTVTNTFLVENFGSGKLKGGATVSAPFKLIEGANYSLKEHEAQVVTITYTPGSAVSDTGTVRFTGGFGAKATVTGRRADAAPNRPERR